MGGGKVDEIAIRAVFLTNIIIHITLDSEPLCLVFSDVYLFIYLLFFSRNLNFFYPKTSSDPSHSYPGTRHTNWPGLTAMDL